MTRRPRRDRLMERDLAALADGSLSPGSRARVERAVAASPELQAKLREQRVAVSATRGVGGERAPAALRARVALARPSRRPARRIGTFAIAGAAAAAAAAVLTLGGGPATSPSVADAAVLATRPPGLPVPQAVLGLPVLHGPRSAGLPFPYWQDRFGWKAIGQRHDRLGGRPATTVFYRRQGQVIAYTIVRGRLPAGTTARSTMHAGTALRTFATHGRRVVTWMRRGQTCVLSGTATSEPTLLHLAAWRGGGGIPY
jgi:hypothetical protein